MQKWLLLTYKIPPEPSAKRVYIWRKLKRIGAILYQESCWILPSTPHSQEQLQWLAAEIIEIGGEATLWEADLILGSSDEVLRQKFLDLVDQLYLEIIEKLKQENPDLESLSRQYQQILTKDFFISKTGQTVRNTLLAARGDKE
jgi:hypothetical protein